MQMHSENRVMALTSLFSLYVSIKSIGKRCELNGCAICSYNKINTTSISFQGFLCEQCSRENSEYIYDTDVKKIFYFLSKKYYKKIFKIKKSNKLIAIAFLKTFINIYH